MFSSETYTDADVTTLLRERGINPTQQRIAVTRTILALGKHAAADQIFRAVNRDRPNVSKATVYNTLGLLARKGIIREVIADPNRVFYDPNTSPHQHIYDEDSGELTDIDAREVTVTKFPALPENAEVRGIDVIIRIRRKTKS
jgi:Fur family transcriptional regulator, iron response regulator